MEIRFDVDCSPTEARQLLGLPDQLPLYDLVSALCDRYLMLLIAQHGMMPVSPAADPDDHGRDAPGR